MLVGKVCDQLTKFHLTLWREDVTEVSALDLGEDWRQCPSFLSLTDLSVKCEVYVEFLPEQVFEFFMQQCRHMRTVQFIGPIDWIVHADIVDVMDNNSLEHLEVFILSNTALELMFLGLDTVHLLLDKCPCLVGLGDLKTWRRIDYYDPDSPMFYKNDSAFMKLRKYAQESNWEIDFDIENCDNFR